MKQLIFFVMGAATGSLITWKLIEKKYKDLANEEIQAVRETYRANRINEIKEENPDNPVFNKPDISTYKEVVNNYSSEESEEDTDEDDDDDQDDYIPPQQRPDDKPYLIDIDEYGEERNYELFTMTYFRQDKVVIDDADEIVDDIDRKLGWDNLSVLDNTEADTIYIRNDKMHFDAEVMYDVRSYVDYMGEG